IRVSRGVRGFRFRTVDTGREHLSIQRAVGRPPRAALLVSLVSRGAPCAGYQSGELEIWVRHQGVEEAAGDPHATHPPVHRPEHSLWRFRLAAPAGAPLPAWSVLPSLFQSGGGGLAELFAARLGVQNPFFVSSGRAALAILFKALRRGSSRREVVIPAYTCFSVPSAVARARLTLRLC